MKTIQLSGKHGNNKVALVDDEDYELINKFKWHVKKHRNTFYAVRTEWVIGGNGEQRHFKMHRVVLGLTNVEEKCDHIDHDGLNCQKNNLRVATHAQNQQNTSARKNSTSKFLGVYVDRNYFHARIQKKHIGYFPKTEDGELQAALAYDKRAKLEFGEFANLNFK